EINVSVHDRQPLFTQHFIFLPAWPFSLRSLVTRSASRQTATTRQPNQTASRIPIHNVKQQKPKIRRRQITSPDPSRSSQHGTFRSNSGERSPALSAPRAHQLTSAVRSQQRLISALMLSSASALLEPAL